MTPTGGMMRRSLLLTLLAVAGASLPARAQQTPAPQQAQTPPLEVGAVAPDFALPASTRYGLNRNPVRLSDFTGKMVVLAFYFRSRTRG